MTRPELHALVDIVMDARERGLEVEIDITETYVRFWRGHTTSIDSDEYPTFSDFTKAVQEYIKTLETK